MVKNIVLLSDGTENDEQDKLITNIAKLDFDLRSDEALSTITNQVSFYDPGVGTGNLNPITQLNEAARGAGLDKNIRDLYRALVERYDEGDEIFMFGFSRGAATVRFLAGMIQNVGIVRGNTISDELLNTAYKVYTARAGFDDPVARDFRQKNSYASAPVIKFLGVFDTVAALDVDIGHVEDQLPEIVKHACHAISIDEHRVPFDIVLWSTREGTSSEQRWFPGVHSDVGGSYYHHGLSDCAFVWMYREAVAHGLKVSPTLQGILETDWTLSSSSEVVSNDASSDVDDTSIETVHLQQRTIRPNPLCKQHDSMKIYYREFGTRLRLIGDISKGAIDQSIDQSVFTRLSQTDYSPKNIPNVNHSFWKTKLRNNAFVIHSALWENNDVINEDSSPKAKRQRNN